MMTPNGTSGNGETCPRVAIGTWLGEVAWLGGHHSTGCVGMNAPRVRVNMVRRGSARD